MGPLRRHRSARAVALVLGLLLLAASAVHGYASWQWRASFGGGGYPQRLASARRAASVEPWNARYAARPDRVRAAEFARRNQPGNAYAALRRAIELDPADERLRAELKRAYAAWYQATTWKAHVQHGREQTGGVLSDEDVVR